MDQGDTVIDEGELRRVHMAPYAAAVDAGVLTVMASLSSWKGEKCHAHRYLIQDLLKGEMGFTGFVLSDWNGVDPLAADYGEAAAMAVNAGIDMLMVPKTWREVIAELKQQVQRGGVPIGRIDDAVARILRVKFACGLFERLRPASRQMSNGLEFGSREHRAVAREAVRKSLVLLKNEGGLLPLDRGARILVVGSAAHDRGRQCGGFTIEWQGVSGNAAIEEGTSIWEGIRAVAPRAVLWEDEREVSDVRAFDVGVVIVGERPYAEGLGDIREPSPVRPGAHLSVPPDTLEPYGNTLEFAALHPEALRTIRELADQGIPVVTVLIAGRPLVVNDELAASSAFVAAWLPGSEGGGVADVLFGEHPFAGRLPMAWPSEMPGGNGKGGTGDGGVRFPRGYGLQPR